MSDMFTAALAYADLRLHVTPVWRTELGVCTCPKGEECISPGKHPAIKEWQTAGTINVDILHEWFDRGERNIGIVCGLSDLVVIDIDPRNNGDVTFAALVNELGPLPASPAADSGGGGSHLVFRRPSGDLVSKLGPGVDLLHGGRQFLVEPSVHSSGGQYRWREGRSPGQVEIAELPERWIERARRKLYAVPPPRATNTGRVDLRLVRASAYLAKIPPAVSGDGGHTQLFNAVCAVMIGFDLGIDDTRRLIANEYNPRCDPPFNERDIEHKLDSANKGSTRTRGYLLVDREFPGQRTSSAHVAPQPTAEAEDTSDTAPNWRALLKYKKDQSPARGYNNVEVFVRYHPNYIGKWTLDLMTDSPHFDGKLMPPEMVHQLRKHADNVLGWTPTQQDVEAAIVEAASRFPFHPIRQYLHSLEWDGTPRLAAMAADYLGSDSPLHAEMVEKFMIGAVARAMRSGCKVDTALMLVGAQGIGKSTFFATLGGNWHADSFVDLTNKDGMMQCHAAWLYELSELENVVMGRAESRLKAWMSSAYDSYRAPYARAVARKARGFVICGTTNRSTFLTDDTGSRRFWIVPVQRTINRRLLAEMRDQLWAEALCAYESGAPWWLEQAAEGERETANVDFTEEDAWTGVIANYLTPGVIETSVSDVLISALKVPVERFDRNAQMRVSRALTQLGWHKVKRREGGRRWNVYRSQPEDVTR